MNKHNYFTRNLLVIALTFFASSNTLGADEVYKWTDKDGVIHYSDIKPGNVESKNIKIKAGKPSGPSSNPQERAQTLDETKSQQLAEQAQQLQDDTFNREADARCQTLRDNLIKFKQNSRIKTKEDGELRYLTPEEISTKKTQYEKMLADDCS